MSAYIPVVTPRGTTVAMQQVQFPAETLKVVEEEGVEALDASQPSPPARSQARAAPGGASVASDRPASSGGALAKGPIGSPGAKAAAGPQSPPTGYPGTSPVRVAGMGSPGKGPKGGPGQLGRYAFNQLSAYKHTS